MARSSLELLLQLQWNLGCELVSPSFCAPKRALVQDAFWRSLNLQSLDEAAWTKKGSLKSGGKVPGYQGSHQALLELGEGMRQVNPFAKLREIGPEGLLV